MLDFSLDTSSHPFIMNRNLSFLRINFLGLITVVQSIENTLP